MIKRHHTAQFGYAYLRSYVLHLTALYGILIMPKVDPLFASVFEDPNNGTPDDITQAGCLALAKLGKDAWNAWCAVFPVKEVTTTDTGTVFKNIADFSGIDFGNYLQSSTKKLALEIDFRGFQFREHSNFSKAKFVTRTVFDGAKFGNYANFSGAEFKERAYFYSVTFSGTPNFSDAIFHGKSRFGGTLFSDAANFKRAKFQRDAFFGGAQFGNNADFRDAQFLSLADFIGAQFGSFARFDGAVFKNRSIFRSSDWASLNDLYRDMNSAKAWAEIRGLTPDGFKEISFKGVNFGGQTDFSGRIFTGPTSFSRLSNDFVQNHPVIFSKAPLFHNCKLNQDISFDGAVFPAPQSDINEGDSAIRAYRTLKLAFAQQQAFREEQKFFRLELEEEEKRASKKQRWLFFLYRWISGYGFRLDRPALLIFFTFVIFILVYGVLAGLSPCFSWQEYCRINYQLIQFSMIQSLPLPGLDKWGYSLQEELFKKNDWHSAFLTISMMLHKGVSLLGVFLVGLALRNLFKMK